MKYEYVKFMLLVSVNFILSFLILTFQMRIELT